MNIIGNIYIDGFANIDNLDGQSHTISDINFGGFPNIFHQDFISENKNLFEKLQVHCLANKSIFTQWYQSLEKNIQVNSYHYEIEDLPPVALIFEANSSRSSFVLFDKPINVRNINFNKNDNIVFYGDKISIENVNLSKGKFYVDTAGNNYSDLFFINNKYPKGTILSISSEYLDEKLEDRYLKELEFTIISHNPRSTTIYRQNRRTTIENEYFVSNKKKSFKVTGLGDKFFLLVSFYNSYYKKSLEESIKISQKKISELFKL